MGFHLDTSNNNNNNRDRRVGLFLSWTILLLPWMLLLGPRCAAAQVAVTAAMSNSHHRRCRTLPRSVSSSALLEDLRQHGCISCRDMTTAPTISTTSASDLVLEAASFVATGSINESSTSLLVQQPPQPVYQIMVLLTSQRVEKTMILTAGILTRQLAQVTLVARDTMPKEHVLREIVNNYIPCHLQHAAQELLLVRYYHIQTGSLKCSGKSLDAIQSAGDLILCSIQNAAPILHSYIRVLNTFDIVDFLVVDATSIAGSLVAESMKIPSLFLVENASVLRTVLGTPPKLPLLANDVLMSDMNHIQHQRHESRSRSRGVLASSSSSSSSSWWSIRTLWRSFANHLQDRLTSLDLTSAFLELNRFRSAVGLPRLRTWTDLWRSPGALLLLMTTATNPSSLASSEAAGWNRILPNLLAVPPPLLPPCLPCPQPDSPGDTNNISSRGPSIVVSAVFRNDVVGLRSSRFLLQALSLARESIRSMMQACHGDKRGGSGSGQGSSLDDCWDGPYDFYVVRPASTHVEVLSLDFVVEDEFLFMESMARHSPVAAVISFCDEENAWTAGLGPAVLCLDDRYLSPRHLAVAVLEALLKHSQSTLEQQQNSQTDGLDWMLKLLEKLIHLKRVNGKDWKNGQDVGRDVWATLGIFPKPQQQNRVFSSPSVVVWLAWSILALTVTYLLVKDAVPTVQWYRLRRLFHHSRATHRFTFAILDEIALRLPDLDRMWAYWYSWAHQSLAHLHDSSPCTGRAGNHHHQQQHHTNSTTTPGYTGHLTSSSAVRSADHVDSHAHGRKRRAAKKRH